MIKEIIQWYSGEITIELKPSEGYKYITNGTVYTNHAMLAKDSDESLWHDTNDEPPTREPISDTEALSIITGGDSDA